MGYRYNPFTGELDRVDTINVPDVYPSQFDADVGVAIPSNHILNVVAEAVLAHDVPIQTVGSGDTLTIETQYSVAFATSEPEKAGLASFNSNHFSVDANGFVGLDPFVGPLQIAVDTFTPPGTDPVVPSDLGVMTVTGAQIAAGTTSTVIQTNSLAANAYEIQIQRSQALASSTVSSNGVSHFDNHYFTVDADGFVSLSGSSVGQTITGDQGGALPPTLGNWNIYGAAVSAGTTPVETSGSGSTLTVNVQTSQAIASSNATNIGLAAFDSAHFSVDANGFVTLDNVPETWIDQSTSTVATSNTNYFITAAITLTLPASPIQGDTIVVNVTAAVTAVIAANTGQFIRLGDTLSASAGTATTSGASGIGASLTLTYQSSTSTWQCRAVQRNWDVV